MNGFLRSFVFGALALAVAGGVQAQSKAKYTARIGHLEAPSQPRHQGLAEPA